MKENILKVVRLAHISRWKNLSIELKQSKEEGRDISWFSEDIERVKSLTPGDEAEKEALSLYQEFQKAPVIKDYTFLEPEKPEEIAAVFPKENNSRKFEENELYDRILAAWLGRSAGCLLGQPVEGWHRDRICGLLKATGNYPIKRYISSDIDREIKDKFNVSDYPGAYGNKKKSWINNIECAPEDDDTNYTIMGLNIMEEYGREFTAIDAAEFMTTNIPIFLTCTAERMAYKNIVNGILPPESASFGNPYREWLGAQIRVDAYAYANPGNPNKAVRMALTDASISHTKNGLYGAAFCAALISASAVYKNMREAIDIAMRFVPPKSRLYRALTDFLKYYETCGDSGKLIGYVHERFDEKDSHDWCHVIPNDLLICAALLCGGDDFEKVVGIAVEAGFDTDCNAATAGSAFGMMYGTKAIPGSWIKPLNGKIFSRIGMTGQAKFEELAQRCLKLADEYIL